MTHMYMSSQFYGKANFLRRIEEENAIALRTLNNMLEFTTIYLKHRSNVSYIKC